MKLTPINPHFNACDQKWELMPEQDGGKLCGECERVLVDFTPFSEQEVLNRQRKSGFSICGRYTKPQVDRLHRHLALEESQNHMPWLVSLAMGAGSLLPLAAAAQDNNTVKGLLGGGAEEIVEIGLIPAPQPPQTPLIVVGSMHAQRTDTTEITLYSSKIPVAHTVPLPGVPGNLRYPVLQAHEQTKTIEIKGMVVDKETGETLPFVTVMVENTSYGTTSDFDGNFALMVPSDMGSVILKTSYVGYQDQLTTIPINGLSKSESTEKIMITVKSSAIVMGGLVVVTSSTTSSRLKYWSNPANWYRRIKNRIRY